jgi:hypothetical protein
VITNVFERKARQEAGAYGVADAPLIVLPHPVGQMPKDKLRELADQFYPQVIQALTRQRS